MRPELRGRVWTGDRNMNTINAEIVEAMEPNGMTHERGPGMELWSTRMSAA